MIVAQDIKDPDDIDDFALDWTNILASGESISTIAVAVISGGVTINSSAINTVYTTARVSGGTAGTDAIIRYRITTSTLRQLDESLTIHVEAR
jgi:hypothetical protein